jgi:hypothetical protein
LSTDREPRGARPESVGFQIAMLAARTTRLQLGTTVVIVPYRHRLLIQRMIEQIDEFASGRLVLGGRRRLGETGVRSAAGIGDRRAG